MQGLKFVDPSALWMLAAGIAIVVLYFVRRRHRPLDVPSLALWIEAAVAEAPRLQARRIRSVLSLLVELAVVAAAVLALARPFRPIVLPETRTFAVVVDVSPSLDVRVGQNGERRLDRAKSAIRRFVVGLAPGDSALVLTSEHGGAVIAPLGTAVPAAIAAIDALHVSVESDPLAAVDRAASLVRDRSGEVVLVTDLASVASREASARSAVRTIPVVDDATNVGIVKLDVEGGRGAPRSLRVTVANFGDRAAARTARLVEEDRPDRLLGESPVSVDAGAEASVVLAVPDDAAGAVRVSLDPGDAFTADDVALVDVPRAAGLRILVLAREEASAPLRAALRSLEGVIDYPRSSVASPERYAELRRGFDLAIFDRCPPPVALLGPAIIVGAESAPAPIRAVGTIADVGVVESSREDPITRTLDFEGLRVGRSRRLDVPSDGSTSVLLRGGTEPLLVLSRGRVPFAVLAFSLEESDSNLWLLPAFPLLVGRLAEALAVDGLRLTPRLHPGDVVDLTKQLGPGHRSSLLADSGGRTVATLETRGRVPWIPPGIFRLRSASGEGARPSGSAVIVDLERREFSDIRCGRPAASLPTTEPRFKEGRQELWILFATAALALLALHWFVFGTGSPRR